MTLEKSNPAAQGGAGRARKCDHVGALIGSENIATAHNLQGFFAAGVVAALFYGEAR